MRSTTLFLSAGVYLVTIVTAPAMLGANREWSVALVTMGVAISIGILALGRPELFSFNRNSPISSVRWILVITAAVGLWGTLPLALPRGDHLTSSLMALEGLRAADRNMVGQALLGYTATCLAGLGAFLLISARPKWARVWLALLACVIATYGLYAVLTDCLGNPRTCIAIASPFINRNTMATFLGLGTIIGMVFVVEGLQGAAQITAKGRRVTSVLAEYLALLFGPVGIFAAITLTSGAALLLTQSRGGILSTASALVVIGIVTWRRRSARKTRAPLVALGTIALIALVWAAASENFVARLETTDIEADDRITLFERTAVMIADRPLTGHGIGTFQEVLPQFRTEAMGAIPDYDKAHNVYLDLAASLGLPASLLIFTVFAWVLRTVSRATLASNRLKLAPLTAIGALTIIAIHSTVDFSMQIPALQVTVAMVLGMAMARARPSSP